MSSTMKLNVKRIQRFPSSLSADGDVNANDEPSGELKVDGFWFERPDHPLLIDVILDTLFAYVKPNDLKSCRLVCKKWNVLSLPIVRSTFEVTILSDESSGNLDPTTPRITDFVQLFESNTLGFPFEKFILGSFDPTFGIGKRFHKLCGEMAKKFDFRGTEEIHVVENMAVFLGSAPMLEYLRLPCFITTKSGAKGVKLFSGHEIPKLKHLRTLNLGYENSIENKLICPTFYAEILNAAENISTLITYDNESEEMESLDVLNILETLGRESSLESLSLFFVKGKHLEVLRKMFVKQNGLKLKHLRIVCSQTPDDVFCFKLIDLMKDSLISLSLIHCRSYPQKCPRMPNLRLLDLGTATLWGTVDTYENILDDFNHNFPSLQHLSLAVPVEQFSMGTECCPTIKSLLIRKLFYTSGPIFERTINVCPNLTELDVDVTRDGQQIIQLIWTQLQRLEKLTIYGRLPGGNNLDSMFTGILDKGKRTAITGKLNGLKHMMSEVRRQTILNLIEEYKTFPSIGNLTSLRELTLNVTARRGPKSHLTDMTGYLGLYSMKNLRSLNVSLCKFSKSCAQILVEDLGLVSWVIQRNAQTDVISPQWNPKKQRVFPSSRFAIN